jgi:molecular chaperone DnaJ
MPPRDFYEVLGVDRTASGEDVKRAYRQMAVQYHPDKNPGDSAAEERFKEVGEAYRVLSDDSLRARYDQYGHRGVDAQAGGGGAGHGTADFMDLFSQVFGDFGDLFGMGGAGGRARRGNDLRYDVEITLEEAYLGKDLSIEIPKMDLCGTCKGDGIRPGTSPTTCAQCAGRGKVVFQQGFFSVQQTCPRCRGRGQMITDPCIECSGDGRLQSNKKVSVSIPKGIRDGDVLRVNGQGDAGAQGAPPGNLLVGVRVKEHEYFERSGPDLFLQWRVSMVDAALGTKAKIPLLHEGDEDIVIPPGTQPGHVVTLRGKGMPRLQRHGQGNLKILVMVETPTDLSPKEKELYRELSKLRGELDEDSLDKRASERPSDRRKRGFFGDLKDLIAGEQKDE